MNFQEPLSGLIERIARAIERLGPGEAEAPDFEASDAFVWQAETQGCLPNVLFYATSNRRHLMPREMVDNERSTAINPGEAVEEKLSLSDRFGLWIGFHNCSQDDYLDMVRSYAGHYHLDIPDDVLKEEALAWALGRGSRSGRVAWQYIQDLAGRSARSSSRCLPPERS
jgi:predicted AAA+ superfamily ATPase